MVQVHAQLIGGPRIPVNLPDGNIVQVVDLFEQVGQAVGRPAGTFKLVLKGKTITMDDQKLPALADGDAMVVVPARKAPSPSLVKAAINTQQGRRSGEVDDDDDDDEEPSASLPATAPAWEKAVIAAARRSRMPSLAVEWLILIRPLRILVLVLFLIGCKISSWYNLGPPFILISIIVMIFKNLGKKKEGEASAYSIFNPGVQRLPGQLDADHVDQQIRRGHM